jgi:phage-related holin
MNKRRLFLTLVEAFQQVPAKLERISQRDSERETYVHQKKKLVFILLLLILSHHMDRFLGNSNTVCISCNRFALSD